MKTTDPKVQAKTGTGCGVMISSFSEGLDQHNIVADIPAEFNSITTFCSMGYQLQLQFLGAVGLRMSYTG